MKHRILLIGLMLSVLGCDILPEGDPPPIIPSDLQLVQLSPSFIQLTWQDNSDNEEGFVVGRKIGTDNWVDSLVGLPADTETWIDSNITLDEVHTYRVYAYGIDSISATIESSITPISFNPQLALSTFSDEVQIGDELIVGVHIQHFEQAFFAVSMRLSFDQNLFEFVVPDSGWLGTVWSTGAIGIAESKSGLVHLSATQLRDSSNVTADGSIASLDFRALAADSTGFEIVENDLIFYDDTGEITSIAELELGNAYVVITE